MKRSWSVLICLASLAPTSAWADTEIGIRVSFKIINRPDGSMPGGVSVFSAAGVIDSINTVLAESGRGYRLILVDPEIRIGGGFQDDRPQPSHYAFRDTVRFPDLRLAMEEDAESNPNLWAWNFGAVNLYVHEATRGLECAQRGSGIIVLGDEDASVAQFTFHMLGHYFGLCNVQGCDCNCCGDEARGCDAVQSDGIADTLPMMGCWNENDIGRHNFGANYDDLTLEQQRQVDLAMRNVMGFRGTGRWAPCGFGFRSMELTEGQLDRLADVASTTRLGVCDGRTFFVESGAGSGPTGRSTRPFRRVAEGVAAANGGGDIVLIHGGAYPELVRIVTPVTLRAPRGQVARIGG